MNKTMYRGYALAMAANGLRPTSFGRLSRHFEWNATVIGNDDAWIAGNEVAGVFWPSHAGYTSRKKMVIFLKELLDAERCCFAVTENVGKMLERIGWIYAGRCLVDYPYPQEKTLWVNYLDMVAPWPPKEA